MDKRSKVNSQLSDKVYDATLDDIETADFEFNSDLYKVNVFGKNVHIAPGRPKKDKTYTGLTYFYVYVIKDDTVISKLGVYEKMTTETKEIYDLTEFPDGSLLLFDMFYNMPALIDDFETDEQGGEEEEEEENIANVTINGKKYTIKGEDVFDLKGKKVGRTIENGKQVNWIWEKTESPSPNFMAPSKINYGNSNQLLENELPDIFEFLKQNMVTLNKKITPETQNKKSILMKIKLRENSAIDSSKKDKYLELINAMTQNKISIYDELYIENVKKLLSESANNGVLSFEEQIMFVLYVIGSYINVMFEFKNKSNEDIDDSEIKQLKYVDSSTIIIMVQIKDKNAFFIEKMGTSLNTKQKTKAPLSLGPVNVLPVNVAPVLPVSLNNQAPLSLNEPNALLPSENTSPFQLNSPLIENSKEGYAVGANNSPPFTMNAEPSVKPVASVKPAPNVNLNEPTPNVNLNESPQKMSGGKIKRGGNNIKLK